MASPFASVELLGVAAFGQSVFHPMDARRDGMIEQNAERKLKRVLKRVRCFLRAIPGWLDPLNPTSVTCYVPRDVQAAHDGLQRIHHKQVRVVFLPVS